MKAPLNLTTIPPNCSVTICPPAYAYGYIPSDSVVLKNLRFHESTSIAETEPRQIKKPTRRTRIKMAYARWEQCRK